MNKSTATMPDISVVVTVLNEAETILELLQALLAQTLKPTVVVIVDGGSSDSTLAVLHEWQATQSELSLKVVSQKGNRSVGRNAGIDKAKSKLIAITDAGCRPHKKWLAELAKTYVETQANVVAGYYEGRANTTFEAAVIPYALVMPDRVTEHFLPATRSMLIEKKWWEKVGKFDEALSDNEDYAFAHQLQKQGALFAFAPQALVTWFPPQTLRQFVRMIYRFARGDVYAGIIRPKVVVLFARYVLLLLLVLAGAVWSQWLWLLVSMGLGGIAYSAWAIAKNLRYVPRGWWWLPVLQFVSDGAVIFGSLEGWWRSQTERASAR